MIPGETGEFFTEQTVESLKAVLAGFDPAAYESTACRTNAERFSTERFERELREFVIRNT